MADFDHAAEMAHAEWAAECEADKLRERVRELEAQLAAHARDGEDARRYAFLRKRDIHDPGEGPVICIRERCGNRHVLVLASDGDADASIDKAMEAARG